MGGEDSSNLDRIALSSSARPAAADKQHKALAPALGRPSDVGHLAADRAERSACGRRRRLGREDEPPAELAVVLCAGAEERPSLLIVVVRGNLALDVRKGGVLVAAEAEAVVSKGAFIER